MKKMISLLLALLLMLGCTALAEETVDYTGYWLLTGVEVKGTPADPALLGVSAYMELYDDGTCLLVAMEAATDGTWAVTDTGITTTDETGVVDTYTYVDGALVCEQDGNKLIFTPESYTMPLNGLTMADFEGDWVFTYVETGNTSYTAEEIGVAMTLSIHAGKGVHTMIFADEPEAGAMVYTGECLLEEVLDFGTVLYIFYVDESGQQDGSGVALLKFDNEELVWYTVDESEQNVFYCFVADPAE